MRIKNNHLGSVDAIFAKCEGVFLLLFFLVGRLAVKKWEINEPPYGMNEKLSARQEF